MERPPSKRGLRLQQLHPIFLTINASRVADCTLMTHSEEIQLPYPEIASRELWPASLP